MGRPARLPCPLRFVPTGVASLSVPRDLPPPPVDLQALERLHILHTFTLTSWRFAGPAGAAARLGIPQHVVQPDEAVWDDATTC